MMNTTIGPLGPHPPVPRSAREATANVGWILFPAVFSPWRCWLALLLCAYRPGVLGRLSPNPFHVPREHDSEWLLGVRNLAKPKVWRAELHRGPTERPVSEGWG